MGNKELIGESVLQIAAFVNPYLFLPFYSQLILNYIFIWGPPQFPPESHSPWRLLPRLLAEPYLVCSSERLEILSNQSDQNHLAVIQLTPAHFFARTA